MVWSGGCGRFGRFARWAEEAVERGREWAETGTEGRPFAPRFNIREGDTAFILKVELPGVRKEDIQVEVDNHALHIRGEKRFDGPEPAGQDRFESPYGRFERDLRLTYRVDRDALRAAFADGVLTVTLPKAPEGPARTVAVE